MASRLSPSAKRNWKSLVSSRTRSTVSTAGLARSAALMLVAAPAVQVEAWGSSGHRVIGVAAMRHLPGDLPAVVRQVDGQWQRQ